jgi:hypothetical protein
MEATLLQHCLAVEERRRYVVVLMDMYAWMRDASAHARLCHALSRTLRAPLWMVDYVFATRVRLIAPSLKFLSLNAYVDATRDALVQALRAFECEFEACEDAKRAQRRAEVRRQQRAAAAHAARSRRDRLPRAARCA